MAAEPSARDVADAAAPQPNDDDTPPSAAQLARAEPVGLHGASGLGCKADRLGNFLHFACRGKNQPEVEDIEVAPAGTALHWGQQGTEFVVAFHPGTKIEATLRWNWRYRTRKLELSWPAQSKAPPAWVGAIERTSFAIDPVTRDTCRAIRSLHYPGEVAALSARERAGIPHGLNTCMPGPFGGNEAWELHLEHIEPQACGRDHCLRMQYSARLPEGDEVSGAEPHELVFRPGALQLDVERSDFDDDGLLDMFVGFDAARGPQPLGQPCIWSGAGEYAPGQLAGGPAWTCVHARDVDKDGLLDVTSYGPFLADAPADCGTQRCPGRLSGPELVGHNTRAGFSFNDGVAQAALARACPNATALIARRGEAGKRGEPERVDLVQTALRVACAKLRGTQPDDAIERELDAAAGALCGGRAAPCPVLSTLRRWAQAKLPAALVPAR